MADLLRVIRAYHQFGQHRGLSGRVIAVTEAIRLGGQHAVFAGRPDEGLSEIVLSHVASRARAGPARRRAAFRRAYVPRGRRLVG